MCLRVDTRELSLLSIAIEFVRAEVHLAGKSVPFNWSFHSFARWHDFIALLLPSLPNHVSLVFAKLTNFPCDYDEAKACKAMLKSMQSRPAGSATLIRWERKNNTLKEIKTAPLQRRQRKNSRAPLAPGTSGTLPRFTLSTFSNFIWCRSSAGRHHLVQRPPKCKLRGAPNASTIRLCHRFFSFFSIHNKEMTSVHNSRSDDEKYERCTPNSRKNYKRKLWHTHESAESWNEYIYCVFLFTLKLARKSFDMTISKEETTNVSTFPLVDDKERGDAAMLAWVMRWRACGCLCVCVDEEDGGHWGYLFKVKPGHCVGGRWCEHIFLGQTMPLDAARSEWLAAHGQQHLITVNNHREDGRRTTVAVACPSLA